MEIRNTLNKFLLSHHASVPSYVRNKLVKLVVDIGRIDWPHFYPEFLSSILHVSLQFFSRCDQISFRISKILKCPLVYTYCFQAVQDVDTMVLGLILLQTTSEELACPREDLSVARKEELHKLLLLQVPSMLNILNSGFPTVYTTSIVNFK